MKNKYNLGVFLTAILLPLVHPNFGNKNLGSERHTNVGEISIAFFLGMAEKNGSENTDTFKMIEHTIFSKIDEKKIPMKNGLVLDLDADYGILIEGNLKISSWRNQIEGNDLSAFNKRDKGREVAGSGRPQLKVGVPELNGHNAVVFRRQELLNMDEDALDHLITGSGYTWFSVMSVYEQVPGLPDVNCFFGNLRNSNEDGKGNHEGFWGGLTDDNRVWMGSRNGITFGRWDENNPLVAAPEPLKKNKYYLIMGRMEAGTGTVKLELFINGLDPVAEDFIPVNTRANSSKMAIGQERDATNHPGQESFDGEISRFLLFERALSKEELKKMNQYLRKMYGI